MDVLSGGLNQGNLIVTTVLLIGLVVTSRQAKMLDNPGILAATALGFVVGGLGHWTWLLILLGFLLASHKATKWRFDEKKSRGMSESEDGHRSYGNVIAKWRITWTRCCLCISNRRLVQRDLDVWSCSGRCIIRYFCQRNRMS